jgi:hypothetical protein
MNTLGEFGDIAFFVVNGTDNGGINAHAKNLPSCDTLPPLIGGKPISNYNVKSVLGMRKSNIANTN